MGATKTEKPRTHIVIVERHGVDRVLGLPGLQTIRLQRQTAVLEFGTAPGCEPVEREFILSEVQRMGAHLVNDAAMVAYWASFHEKD